MKSRLIAVAIHKRVICGNDRFAPRAVVPSMLCDHALRWTGARGRYAFDPSLQLRGNGRRQTAGRCPGDRYSRSKIQARRLEAAGLCLALSVRSS
jgi:hypothetical protein